MVDTGAKAGNYVNLETLEWLRDNGVPITPTDSTIVCSAFNHCQKVFENVKFNIVFTNVITKTFESINITATVLDTKHPLIIGLPSIKKIRSHVFNAGHHPARELA